MNRTPVHPVNPYIRNAPVTDFYLNMVRKGRARNGRFSRLCRLFEYFLHCEVRGKLPKRLYLPHPFGILTGVTGEIGEDVTLMHFVTIGPNDPWYQGAMTERIHPILEEGVYVSMGAKVMGPITVGAWSVIAANAVVTEDIPPFSTVFGQNRILRSTEGGPPQLKRYLEMRAKRTVP